MSAFKTKNCTESAQFSQPATVHRIRLTILTNRSIARPSIDKGSRLHLKFDLSKIPIPAAIVFHIPSVR